MAIMGLNELYIKAAEKAKEAYSDSKLLEWLESGENNEIPDTTKREEKAFRKVVDEYLKYDIGINESVEVYCEVFKKEKNYIILRILCSLDMDGEMFEWGWEFNDTTIQDIINIIGSDGQEKAKDLNIGDHVICTLSANKSIKEMLEKRRPFSFDWRSLKKAESLNDDGKYICNLVRVLKKPEDGAFVVIPVGNNLKEILDQKIKDKIDELKEIEEKIKESEEKKNYIKNLDKDITERFVDISNKNKKILELQDELKSNKKALSDIKKEFENNKQTLFDIKKEIEEANNSVAYEAVKFAKQFILTGEEKEAFLPKVDFKNFNTDDEKFIDKLVAYMQGYMYNDDFLYSKDILKNTFYALQTNQLIIYAGKPGSGKSQLVRHLADLFGAGYADVAVQSSWMDKSDLLGFYDPLHNNYVGTAFLDKLRKMCDEARQNPERLFIICLDEMNLAHVEYYFADFLSRLQASDNERFIDLYSKTIENALKEEIILRTSRCIENTNDTDFYKNDFLANLDTSNIEEFVKVKKMWHMLIEYPHKIVIPKNIKFFSTINTDATTKDLSPKVLDRAFVFKLEEQKDINVPAIGNYDKCVDFYSIVNGNKHKNTEVCKDNVRMAIISLGGLNISISKRVEKQLSQIGYAEQTDLIDILLACVVLPKIRGISMEEADKKLKYRCDAHSYSKTVYEFIQKNSNGSRDYSFWR